MYPFCLHFSFLLLEITWDGCRISLLSALELPECHAAPLEQSFSLLTENTEGGEARQRGKCCSVSEPDLCLKGEGAREILEHQGISGEPCRSFF